MSAEIKDISDGAAEAEEQAARARAAAQVLATASRSQRHAVIARLQEELVQREAALVAANEKDLEAAAAAKYTYIERLKLAKKLPSLKARACADLMRDPVLSPTL